MKFVLLCALLASTTSKPLRGTIFKLSKDLNFEVIDSISDGASTYVLLACVLCDFRNVCFLVSLFSDPLFIVLSLGANTFEFISCCDSRLLLNLWHPRFCQTHNVFTGFLKTGPICRGVGTESRISGYGIVRTERKIFLRLIFELKLCNSWSYMLKPGKGKYSTLSNSKSAW